MSILVVLDDAEGEVDGFSDSYPASRKYVGYGGGRVDSVGHGVLTCGVGEPFARLALLANVCTKSNVSFRMFVPGSTMVFVGCDVAGFEEKGFCGDLGPNENGLRFTVCDISFVKKMLPPMFAAEVEGGWMAFTWGGVDFCWSCAAEPVDVPVGIFTPLIALMLPAFRRQALLLHVNT